MRAQDFDKIRKEIHANTLRKRRTCLIPECSEQAIYSHIIQRKGVLNHLISGGHLYEIVFNQYPELHYTIKKVGWKDALTFRGLCSQHDSAIFQHIEKQAIDFSDYRSLLLLSYRPLLYEYRLKEMVAESFRNIMRDERLVGLIHPVGMRVLLEAQDFMMWDLEFMSKALQEDLSQNTQQYVFHSFKLPRIEACASLVFSLNSLADSFANQQRMDVKNKELMANVIFHLIPSDQETTLILGYHALSEKHVRPLIEHYQNLNTNQLLKELSDVLIRKCGTWACSERFYELAIRPRQKQIVKLMNYFTLRKQFSNEAIKLNLFDSVR